MAFLRMHDLAGIRYLLQFTQEYLAQIDGAFDATTSIASKPTAKKGPGFSTLIAEAHSLR